MAFDELLVERVRDEMINNDFYSEKKMFGGMVFMLSRNMACAVVNDDLIVRVGPQAYDEYLAEEDAGVFDMSGKVMKGWVVISGEKLMTRENLKRWVDRGVGFCQTLPPK
jgi:TfoX/Sxy family transcriptional regulator of competence genes